MGRFSRQRVKLGPQLLVSSFPTILVGVNVNDEADFLAGQSDRANGILSRERRAEAKS